MSKDNTTWNSLGFRGNDTYTFCSKLKCFTLPYFNFQLFVVTDVSAAKQTMR